MPKSKGHPKKQPIPKGKRDRYGRSSPIQRQLEGKPDCLHIRQHVDTNSKGEQFSECDSCGAFLGFD